MCVERFSIKNEGMASHESQEKRHYIETFRVILSAWPAFPVDLEASLLPSAVATHVWVVEKQLARFYTQSFFNSFGRPPIVPHLIPNPPLLSSVLGVIDFSSALLT